MKFTIGANPADPVIPDTDESAPVSGACDGDGAEPEAEADSEADELINDHQPEVACEEAAVAA